MVCIHRLGAKLLEKGGDISLGHWSWMKFQGKQGSKVLVITAYQVSQTSAAGLGMETVYMRQWRKLAKTRTKVNPRAQFWEDLTSVIQLARASQEEVLLMLDVNADIKDTGFSTFLLDCGLHDLHNDISIYLPPETYYRGTRKIDFCLGTQGVALEVAQAEITAYEDGFKYSDHGEQFVDLNKDAIFSSQGADPTSRHGRGLRTKNKMATQRYRDLFCKKLREIIY